MSQLHREIERHHLERVHLELELAGELVHTIRLSSGAEEFAATEFREVIDEARRSLTCLPDLPVAQYNELTRKIGELELARNLIGSDVAPRRAAAGLMGQSEQLEA